ncbi:hypothetical protein Y1Q_0008862 [Alligator mississippiensis]|uniref:DDE Tnp4 domain-containing protein n=1 Tax=Alligator mississippiensis TaxID=8496 RepID=A0A151NAD4_ALLMI|nr:hypothetical protein Y1Q_0008862 [Alligator mississippiensis]
MADTLHSCLPSLNAPSPGSCHHAAASWTLCCCPDPSRDTDTLLLYATTSVVHAFLGLQPHQLWAHPVRQDLWLDIIQTTWDDKQWLESFCITQATFVELPEQLHLHLDQQNATVQQPLLMDTWLAITLLKWSMPASLHYISHFFSMGKAIAGEVIQKVCSTLEDVVGHTVLWVHNPLELVVGFHIPDFPQCAVALDWTHIPMTCPSHSDHPHYSQQSFNSIMLQAIVDHNGAFMNVSTSWVDSTHNARIFFNSTLPAMVESRHFMSGLSDLLLSSGTPYPVLPWLMTNHLLLCLPLQATWITVPTTHPQHHAYCRQF